MQLHFMSLWCMLYVQGLLSKEHMNSVSTVMAFEATTGELLPAWQLGVPCLAGTMLLSNQYHSETDRHGSDMFRLLNYHMRTPSRLHKRQRACKRFVTSSSDP